ncbi:hypothetical protein MBLNU457_g0925t2 [Dothideomycetes sp. NU457]
MGSHSAFFYGTLMAPQVLHRVCHGPANPTFTSSTSYLKTTPAILHNHRRHRVRGADYPAILATPSSTVRGTYVTGLTDADIYRLDIFEGDEYERRKITCRILVKEGDASGAGNEEGDEVLAETYIWVAGEQRLEDREWDFAEFQREKMRFWVGGSERAEKEYAEVDEAVRQQDGTGGRGVNGAIGGVLAKEHEKDRSKDGDAGEPIKSAV